MYDKRLNDVPGDVLAHTFATTNPERVQVVSELFDELVSYR
jgi:hypothetical protein